MKVCPKCGRPDVIKNGNHLGKQRHRCKACGFQFTRTTARGRPASEKATAVLLYTLGVSLTCIAKMFKVSTPTVMHWIRLFSERPYEKAEPGEAVMVEIDEMLHYLASEKTAPESGKLIVAVPIDSLPGNVGVVVKKHSAAKASAGK